MSELSDSTTWFDEINLDPGVSWLRMGTRQLGERPWLIHDQHRVDELALKHQLCTERHDEVFAASEDASEPSAAVLELVLEALAAAGVGHPPAITDLHPLDAAGRLIQEDLCLLRRDVAGWVLAAASLCFPSRWRLADKMGRPLAGVHQPVTGYDTELGSRVDSLFDALTDQIVWRRNWFIHPDANLFQPDRPAGGDPTIPAERCMGELVVRSERQTLRALPTPGWVLFTIRTQQASLGQFLESAERQATFIQFLDEATAEHTAHLGLTADQVHELGSALAT